MKSKTLSVYATALFSLLLLISCKKDKNDPKPSGVQIPKIEVNDASNNTYNIVNIGSQVWLSKNLVTRNFRNGDKIQEAHSVQEWNAFYDAGIPCIILYGILANNLTKYGFLYNKFAINDPRGIAPLGFKIPSQEDFEALENFISTEHDNPMQALKSKTGWTNFGGTLTEGTDAYGFTGLPGGLIRKIDSSYTNFYDENFNANFWSTALNDEFVFFCSLNYDHTNSNSIIKANIKGEYLGLYVRCLKE